MGAQGYAQLGLNSGAPGSTAMSDCPARSKVMSPRSPSFPDGALRSRPPPVPTSPLDRVPASIRALAAPRRFHHQRAAGKRWPASIQLSGSATRADRYSVGHRRGRALVFPPSPGSLGE
jgi:hypothetical protein